MTLAADHDVEDIGEVLKSLVGVGWPQGLGEVPRAQTRGASTRVSVKSLKSFHQVLRANVGGQPRVGRAQASHVRGLRSRGMFF